MGRRARIELRNARYCFGRAVDKGGRATCALGILNMTSYCVFFAQGDGKGKEKKTEGKSVGATSANKSLFCRFDGAPSTRQQNTTPHIGLQCSPQHSYVGRHHNVSLFSNAMCDLHIVSVIRSALVPTYSLQKRGEGGREGLKGRGRLEMHSGTV